MKHITLRFDALSDAVACCVAHDNMVLLEGRTRGGKTVYFATDSGATGADELMRLWGVEEEHDDEIVGPLIVQAHVNFNEIFKKFGHVRSDRRRAESEPDSRETRRRP